MPISTVRSSSTDGSGQRPPAKCSPPQPSAPLRPMPWTLPEGVVSGVLQSACASNQIDADRPVHAREPAEDAERERVVAAEHERQLARPARGLHVVGDLAAHGEDLRRGTCARSSPTSSASIGSLGDRAEVVHADAELGEPPERARRSGSPRGPCRRRGGPARGRARRRGRRPAGGAVLTRRPYPAAAGRASSVERLRAREHAFAQPARRRAAARRPRPPRARAGRPPRDPIRPARARRRRRDGLPRPRPGRARPSPRGGCRERSGSTRADERRLQLPLGGGVGEAGADERARQRRGRGDAQLPSVERAAVAARGGERLAVQRVVDDCGERVLGVAAGDRDGPLGNAVEEVDGAVERIDDPLGARSRRALPRPPRRAGRRPAARRAAARRSAPRHRGRRRRPDRSASSCDRRRRPGRGSARRAAPRPPGRPARRGRGGRAGRRRTRVARAGLEPATPRFSAECSTS